MCEFNDSAIEHGQQDIEGLSPSVKAYRYSGMDDFCQIISLENDRLYGSFRVGGKAKARASGASWEGLKDHSITLPQTEDTLQFGSAQRPMPIRTFHRSRLADDCNRQNILDERDNTKNTPDEDYSPEKEDHSEHLIFFIEPTTFEHDFINSDPPVGTNTFFNPKTKILIVKMLGPAHEQATVAFDDMLKGALEPMGLTKAIQSWGSTEMLAIDGTRKKADGGWGPRRPPPNAPRRPTIILEVANSETYAKLRRDCQYWIDPERQEANAAIGVNLHTKRPEISIDLWEWSSQTSRPINRTHLTISKKSDGAVYFDPDHPPPQVVIPFESLFRRPAQINRERDIVIETQELVEFASMVWEVQFEQDKE
ncbi:uncharacterized protein N7479_002632 [Penicillium vulpinum]|uniref:Restriction endonuclease domain-containing protein n=1 Tax=Penicillium vulpinum TaxID=29845 RepID=A0A1V6RZB6_9EURO|nr:uncharacterized protein N7479_002632 [Penicillium vulpinum]KAJ5972714.1 hypothetical protein N7479_002632 [Penicillium vulpinum]OQE06946.1 hypothetical protein PENVUL_c015G04917 [Penicillium vulpinum]